MNITVTEAAAKKAESMSVEAGMIGIRAYVHGTGCSGMSHSLTFVDAVEERDTEVVPYFYIDPIATLFMDGATVDYVTSGLSPTFEFRDVFKAIESGSGMCGGCGGAGH